MLSATLRNPFRFRFCVRRSLTFFLAVLTGGCSIVGPTSISYDRLDYNEVLQSTAVRQTLLNILRVAHDEMPVFVDVTEVDAARTVTGSITGGASNIGDIGNPKTTAGTFGGVLGAVGGTAGYQDQPTVRYQPVIGQALVAQVGTPLSAASLSNILDSGAEVATVLTLSLERIAPGYREYWAAVNALVALDQYGAVWFAATSTPERPPATTPSLVVNNSGERSPDSLTIYFQPRHVDHCSKNPNRGQIALALWQRFTSIYGVDGNKANAITLHTKGKPAKDTGGWIKYTDLPLLITYSALGIMKANTAINMSHVRIEKEQDVRNIIQTREDNKHKSDQGCEAVQFYLLNDDDNSPVSMDKIRTQYAKGKFLATAVPPGTEGGRALTEQELTLETVLGRHRVFMLVAQSDYRPTDAYVTVQYKGQWYSILEEDTISKQTLALIHEFNIVQAAPAQPPLTPTISVGAR